MAKNTIIVKGITNTREQLVATAVAITPGALVERTAAGLVQAHSTASGKAEALFALEDDFQGKGIGDAYAVSVPIMCWHAIPGERVYALAADTIAVAGFVESKGDGTVRAYTSGLIIGIALTTGAAAGRVTIEII